MVDPDPTPATVRVRMLPWINTNSIILSHDGEGLQRVWNRESRRVIVPFAVPGLHVWWRLEPIREPTATVSLCPGQAARRSKALSARNSSDALSSFLQIRSYEFLLFLAKWNTASEHGRSL